VLVSDMVWCCCDMAWCCQRQVLDQLEISKGNLSVVAHALKAHGGRASFGHAKASPRWLQVSRPTLHYCSPPCHPRYIPPFPPVLSPLSLPFSFSCAHSLLLGHSHAGASCERAHTLTCTCNHQVERECPAGWRAIVESIEYRDMMVESNVESIQDHETRQGSPYIAKPIYPELQAGLLDAMRATVAAAREMKTLVFAKVREWQEQELASRRAARQHHLARHAQ